jgi:hypothetical protein
LLGFVVSLLGVVVSLLEFVVPLLSFAVPVSEFVVPLLGFAASAFLLLFPCWLLLFPCWGVLLLHYDDLGCTRGGRNMPNSPTLLMLGADVDEMAFQRSIQWFPVLLQSKRA